MEIGTKTCTLRPYAATDRERLAEIANDRRIWINLRDRFPHPYTLADAEAWLDLLAGAGDPPRQLAVAHEDLLVGGIGIDVLDGHQSHVAEIGYWLTPSVWDSGIATSALSAMIPYVFENFPIHRLEGSVYAWNPASARVLEKCGFVLEGRKADALVKDGEITDEILYGLIAPPSD